MQKKIVEERRPGGGWNDSDNEETKQESNIPQFYQPQEESPKYQGPFKSKLSLLTLEELSNQNCEYEKKIVEDHIQPVGARIKSPAPILEQFLKSCVTLEEQKIGSILLYYINTNSLPQMKAKCLYAIEYLSRKNEKYKEFFIANIEIVENCETSNNIIKEAQHEALRILKNQGDYKKQQKKVDSMLGNIHEIPTVQQASKQQQNNKQIDLLDEDKPSTTQKPQNAFNFIKNTNSIQEEQTVQITKKTNAFNFIQSEKPQVSQQQKGTQNLLDDENEFPEQKISQKKNAFEFIKSDKQSTQTEKMNAFNFIPKQENKNKGNNLLDLNFDIFDSSPVTSAAPPQKQQTQITSNNLLNMYQQPSISNQLPYQFENQINQQQPLFQAPNQQFGFQYNYQQQQPNQISFSYQNQYNQQSQFSINQELKQNSEKKKQVETAFDFINL